METGRRCCECGSDEWGTSLFPFYKNNQQLYVCYHCLKSHRGMLKHVCPTR